MHIIIYYSWFSLINFCVIEILPVEPANPWSKMSKKEKDLIKQLLLNIDKDIAPENFHKCQCAVLKVATLFEVEIKKESQTQSDIALLAHCVIHPSCHDVITLYKNGIKGPSRVAELTDGASAWKQSVVQQLVEKSLQVAKEVSNLFTDVYPDLNSINPTIGRLDVDTFSSEYTKIKNQYDILTSNLNKSGNFITLYYIIK
jgi:hypothetical protein